MDLVSAGTFVVPLASMPLSGTQVTVGMSAACDVSSTLTEVHTSGNMRPVDSDMQKIRVVPCSVVTRPLLLACVLYICTIKTEFLDQRVYMPGVTHTFLTHW